MIPLYYGLNIKRSAAEKQQNWRGKEEQSAGKYDRFTHFSGSEFASHRLKRYCCTLGSVVGIERANKRYAAGIRTLHIGVLGAALSTIMGLYFCAERSGMPGYQIDSRPASCNGFSAGTIIVDRRADHGALQRQPGYG